MGRTFPSYTQMLEKILRRIEELGKQLGPEEEIAAREIVKASRTFQGPLLYEDVQDMEKIVIFASLIDIYKRLVKLERCLLKDGSSD